MEAMPGLANVEDSRPVPGIEWRVAVDRAQAAKFGVDVSPETKRLWQSLLVGPDPEIFSSAPRRISGDPGSGKKPSVGVLGFVNLTTEPRENYFAKGLVQDITTALSQRRDYVTVAELPTLTTETGSLDVRRIAATYNVQYLLNGSVQRVADDLRVNVQLIDSGNGHSVWAQRFDGRAQESLEFQDRIAQSVMIALGIEWQYRDHHTKTDQVDEDRGKNNNERRRKKPLILRRYRCGFPRIGFH